MPTGLLTAPLLGLLAGGAAAPPGASSLSAPPDVAAPPPSAQRSPSGLAMTVLRPGRGGEHPAADDCVKVHYTAWKRDGTLLSASYQRGEPESQCLRTAFAGIAEALRAMTIGERRRVWVPAALTYRGDDDDPPPRLDATFDLELVAIQKAPLPPASVGKPPASVRRLPSGLAIEVLVRGSATRRPAETSQVKLHFSGWTSAGRLIESSVMANHPAVFPIRGVIAGWREALLSMVVGTKVRLWIPAGLAYGRSPRRGQPRGDLVYELELLAIE